jgi:quercetin dioxygenase-like cupin family protein
LRTTPWDDFSPAAGVRSGRLPVGTACRVSIVQHKTGTTSNWRSSGTEHFTGSVWNSRLIDQEGPLTMISVQFAPGARSDWHSHPEGQVLYVLAGAGIVQNEDGATVEMAAGDVVHAPPGELHWHGARPDSPMLQLSITTAGPTEWHEKVTDEQYDAALPRDHS